MSRDALPHVDASGRGLDDGDCVHCGASGSLQTGECEARLRAALDAREGMLDRLVPLLVTVTLDAPTRDPVIGGFLFNVRDELERTGRDVQSAVVAEAKRRAGHRTLGDPHG